MTATPSLGGVSFEETPSRLLRIQERAVSPVTSQRQEVNLPLATILT